MLKLSDTAYEIETAGLGKKKLIAHNVGEASSEHIRGGVGFEIGDEGTFVVPLAELEALVKLARKNQKKNQQK
jgi:hypothetical protein